MQVSPTSLSFTKANLSTPQSVKVTGGAWSVSSTPGLKLNPTSGADGASFEVTAESILRAGSPATITVAVPNQPSVSISVSLTE